MLAIWFFIVIFAENLFHMNNIADLIESIRMKRKRHNRRFTQDNVARLMGITLTAYSAKVRLNNFRNRDFPKLEKILDVTFDFSYTDNKEQL